VTVIRVAVVERNADGGPAIESRSDSLLCFGERDDFEPLA
jgi:hypothetical protein